MLITLGDALLWALKGIWTHSGSLPQIVIRTPDMVMGWKLDLEMFFWSIKMSCKPLFVSFPVPNSLSNLPTRTQSGVTISVSQIMVKFEWASGPPVQYTVVLNVWVALIDMHEQRELPRWRHTIDHVKVIVQSGRRVNWSAKWALYDNHDFVQKKIPAYLLYELEVAQNVC